MGLIVGFQNIQTKVQFLNKHGVHIAYNQLRQNFPAPKEPRLAL